MAKHWGLPHWPSPKFSVGDRVSFPFGNGDLEGVITEDRGAYGNPLRHIYRLEAVVDEWNNFVSEIPEDRLTLKEPAKKREKAAK